MLSKVLCYAQSHLCRFCPKKKIIMRVQCHKKYILNAKEKSDTRQRRATRACLQDTFENMRAVAHAHNTYAQKKRVRRSAYKKQRARARCRARAPAAIPRCARGTPAMREECQECPAWNANQQCAAKHGRKCAFSREGETGRERGIRVLLFITRLLSPARNAAASSYARACEICL